MFLLDAVFNRWKGNVRELKTAVERACMLATQGGWSSVLNLDLKHTPAFLKELSSKYYQDANSVFVETDITLEQLPTFDLMKLMQKIDDALDPQYRRQWTLDKREKVLEREQGSESMTEYGTTNSNTEADPYEPIYDLTYDDLTRVYARGLKKRHGNYSKAAAYAKKDHKTIAKWAKLD